MAVDNSCVNFVEFEDSPSSEPQSDPNDPSFLGITDSLFYLLSSFQDVPPPKHKMFMTLEEKCPKSVHTTFGTWILGEKIGRGAASCVYRAMCSESGDLAAIKKIKTVGLNSKAVADVLVRCESFYSLKSCRKKREYLKLLTTQML